MSCGLGKVLETFQSEDCVAQSLTVAHASLRGLNIVIMFLYVFGGLRFPVENIPKGSSKDFGLGLRRHAAGV